MRTGILLLALCIGTSPLYCEETRSQDLQCILERTFLHPQMDQFLNMLVLEATSAGEKTLDAKEAIGKFKELFAEEATQVKLRDAYTVFSDAEVREIRKIFESPAYEKYMQHGGEAFQKNLTVLREMFKEIVDQNGVVKSMEDLGSDFLEITSANFEKEVKESSKPLVVDFYSTSCPPCRLMEPIFEELSQEFGETVRFVKVNCGAEIELARKYGVTQLPTFLLIKPGQEEAAAKVIGFTPKEAFKGKISEFLVEAD